MVFLPLLLPAQMTRDQCVVLFLFFPSLRSLYFFFYLRKDGPPFKKRCLYERQVILFFHVIVLYSSVERIFFYFPSFFSSLINVKHVAAARALAVAYFLNGFISTTWKKNPIHSINSLHELATTMADRNRISRLPSLERLFFWIFIGMTLEERERYFLGYNLPLLGGSLNKNLLNKMSCVLSPLFFFSF